VSKQKLSDLAKKRGIYAVLLVGVFVVVVVAMVMLTNQSGSSGDKKKIDLNESPLNASQGGQGDKDSTYAEDDMQDPNVSNLPENQQVADNSPVDVTKEPVATPVAEATLKPTQDPVKDANTNDNQTAQDDKKETQPVMQNTAENLSFNKESGLDWPVKGNIILPYSMDETTYYATLKQYMTNPAILIAGEVGTEVKAAAKGIVTSIEKESRTGNTITMDIGSDYKLVYGQLDKVDLKVGDTVEAGAVIGKISKATKFFSIEGSHLFFQVYEGDETLDPMSLLKAE
jgi:murein DD-endopeptidase MepM/ murein hydrolase activator NlpD